MTQQQSSRSLFSPLINSALSPLSCNPHFLSSTPQPLGSQLLFIAKIEIMCCVPFWARVMLLTTLSSSPIRVGNGWLSSFLTTEWWSSCVSRFPYPAPAALCLTWSCYSNFERNFLFNILASIPWFRPRNSIAISYGSFIFSSWRNPVLFSIMATPMGLPCLPWLLRRVLFPRATHCLFSFDAKVEKKSSLTLILVWILS